MAQHGPVPKRSDQLIRRNKQEVPVEKITAIGLVEAPELGISDPHPIVADMYDSMKVSAQRKFMEASDWAYARFALTFCDYLLKSSRPSGQLLATVHSMLGELLLTEGSRRRVRLEVERNQQSGEVLDVADLFRRRLLSE